MTSRTSDLLHDDHASASVGVDDHRPDDEGRSIASAIGTAGDTVRRAVDEAASAVPDAIAGSRDAVGRATSALHHEPEPNLVAGITFLAGVGLGLIVAGAPRLVTLATLAPAVALGSALFGRRQPLALRVSEPGR